MTKLTKQQIELLEKELKQFENEAKEAKLILLIISIFFAIAFIFGTNWIKLSVGSIIGIEIGLIIAFFIRSSKLNKTNEKIREIKFKLAGDKNWLKKQSQIKAPHQKPKEKKPENFWG